MPELTLELLDEAIRQIKAFEANREIIGFKVHPADLCAIREGTKTVWAILNNKFMGCPPYEGFILEPDVSAVRGEVTPIRKETPAN